MAHQSPKLRPNRKLHQAAKLIDLSAAVYGFAESKRTYEVRFHSDIEVHRTPQRAHKSAGIREANLLKG